MKWRDVAHDLYLALHELDKLTAGGQCNCEREYVCVNCRVSSALGQYKAKYNKECDEEVVRRFNCGTVQRTTANR